MTTSASPVAITVTDDLDALLSVLGLDDESITALPIVAKPEIELCEADLEAAVLGAESSEAIAAHYNSACGDTDELPEAPVIVDPMTDPSVLLCEANIESAVVPEKTKAELKAEVAAAKKQAAADKKAAAAAAKKDEAGAAPEKKEPVARKHYASKSERITDKFGSALGEYTVLELSDALLEGDALAAKQAETMQRIKDAGVKVQNRTTFLMEFAAGKAAKLNAVATTALNVLKRDGKITTGENGNLFVELSKQYKKSSANTMGNNTILALKVLKMIGGEKGEFVANPQSLYMAKINPMLGLTT